jgi:hypothetical protein
MNETLFTSMTDVLSRSPPGVSTKMATDAIPRSDGARPLSSPNLPRATGARASNIDSSEPPPSPKLTAPGNSAPDKTWGQRHKPAGCKRAGGITQLDLEHELYAE